MSWSYWLVETITGERLAPVTVYSPSIARRLNVSATSQVTADTSGLSAAQTRRLFEQWTVSLVPHWNGEPVAYAPIERVSRAGTDLLTLDCVDVRALAAARFPFTVGQYSQPPWEMYELDMPSSLLQAFEWPFGSVYEPHPNLRARLPFVENYYESGDVFWRIPNHEMRTAASIAEDLQGREGGPSSELRPRRMSDGSVGIFLSVRPPTSRYEYLVPSGRDVVAWSWSSDAKNQLTGVFVTGEGSDTSMKVKSAGQRASNPYAGPFRDGVFPMKQVSDDAQLQAHANAYRNMYERPVLQFDLTVRIGQMLPTVQLGSIVRVYPIGEKFVPERWYECTLIGAAFDGSRNMTLELQEAS